MSADSDIAAILTRVASDTSYLATATNDMVQKAIETIDQPPDWEDFAEATPKESGISTGVFGRRETPQVEDPDTGNTFRFPAYPFIKPIPFPGLHAMVRLTPSATPTAPILRLPAITPFTPAEVPEFTATPPDIDLGYPEIPPAPEIPEEEDGAFLDFAEFNIPELRIPFLELLPPPPQRVLPTQMIADTIGGIQGLIFDGDEGLNALIARFRRDAEEANEFLPLVLSAGGISGALERNGVAAMGAEAVARIERMLARLDTWALPMATRSAITAEVHRLAARWQALAAGAVAADGQAKALDIQAAARDALAAFARKAGELQGLEIELALKAHAFAGRYAKRLIGVLLAVHDAEHYSTYDTTLAHAESQLAGSETQLTAALLELELAAARLERENNLQTRNADGIRRAEYQAQQARQQVSIYAAITLAARKERALKRLPYDHWGLQLKAADQLTEADIAYAELAQAEIYGDKAALDAAAAKIRLYQSQARAYESESKTAAQVAQVDDIANDALIAEYRARVKGMLLQREQEVSKADYGIDQKIAVIERFLEEARLAVSALQLHRDFEDKKADGNLDEYKISIERMGDLIDAETERLKGMTDLHLDGAAIVSNMAGAVASQATRLVDAVLREF